MMNDDTAGIEEKKADTSMEIQQTTDISAQKEPEEVQEEDPDSEEENQRIKRAGGKAFVPTVHGRTEEAAKQHARLSWTACYQDHCPIHYSDKLGSGWFPRQPRGRKNRGTQTSETTSAKVYTIPEETPSEWERRHSLLAWTECYRDYCPIHYDEKEIAGFFPHEKGDVWVEASKDQESLSMMNAPESNQQGPASDEEDLEELDGTEEDETESEDEAPSRTVVKEIQKTHITILTCFWKEVNCTVQCDLGTQHYHIVYDKETRPKEYAKTLRINLCQNKGCSYGPDIHAHQGSDDRVEMLNVPDSVRQRVWGSNEQSLSMMIDGSMINIDDGTDERADRDFLSAPFECTSYDCPYLIEEHYHLFNVDPRFPRLPIMASAFWCLVRDECVCNSAECEWNDILHVHFPKNE